jgi:hypothetical protein
MVTAGAGAEGNERSGEMRYVMVIFSSVTLSKKLAECAIETARKDRSTLLIVEIRSRRVPHRVAIMMHERGFMGQEVVDRLEREISRERQDHLDRNVNDLKARAEAEGIPTESITLDRASVRRILEIARERNVRVIIAEKRIGEIEGGGPAPFEVIRVKE